MREYKQCTRCLMDTTTRTIHFDDNGVCNYCHSYANFELQKPWETIFHPNKIAYKINEMKLYGKSKKYDCILGISGGVDSSYLCHLLKIWNIRPLLVHFDNNWNTQLAEDNMEAMVKGTGFDFYRYKVDWAEFRELQRAYFKASVLDVEVLTDHGAIALLYREAKKHGIRYVIVGQNYTTEFVMPRDWNYVKWDLVNMHAICEHFSAVQIKSLPIYNILSVQKQFTYIEPLQYIRFNKNKSIQTLMHKYGWKPYPYKHYESLFTWFYQAYYLPVKFGIDKRKLHLSNLIWSHQMTREQALEQMKKPLHEGAEFKQMKNEVITKLGFSSEEWDIIMKTPPVPHMKFPNSRKQISNLLSKI